MTKMRKTKTFTSIAISMLFVKVCFSQPEDVKLNKDYLKGYISDTKSILASPFKWESSDWLKAGIFVGITAGLYTQDDNIRKWIQKNRSKTTDRISDFARPFGEGIYTVPAIGLLYIYGDISGNKKASQTALMSLESFVITGIFTQAIKFTAHRHRPPDSSKKWDGPSLSLDNLSFPSGHTSSAFSIASVIASTYKDKPLIPILSYGVATLTGLSRINDDKHWASDVFFGAGLGYFIGNAVVNLHTRNSGRLSVIPTIGNAYFGMRVEYNF